LFPIFKKIGSCSKKADAFRKEQISMRKFDFEKTYEEVLLDQYSCLEVVDFKIAPIRVFHQKVANLSECQKKLKTYSICI